MKDTSYIYGSKVVEFFKHSDEDLQELIKQKEIQYFRSCESPAYPEPGVNVDWFSDKPLSQALNELTQWLTKGYTVASALNRPLYLKVQLKKPQALIDADLLRVSEDATAEYAASRYARNVAEQERQIEFTLARQAREAEAAAVKAVADLLDAARENALSDLIAAYAKPAKSKAKVDAGVTA